MTFPCYPLGAFGPGTSLAIAVLIGAGFGFTLERGGFGSSRRLAAQFYLYDMTVFKVMFTAILTCMLGFFACLRLGLVDLNAVWINPTFLWPQIVGGFLLGAGFVISGYCPGTAIVATASGKLDGLLSLGGVALGIVLYALVYTPALDAFQKSGAHGRLLLSDLLHLDASWLALGIVLMAVLAFAGAEKVEKLFSARAEAGRATRLAPRLRMRISLALLAAGLLLALPPHLNRTAEAAGAGLGTVTPIELARDLVEGIHPVTVLDLRDPAESGKDVVPGSVPTAASSLADASSWEEKFPRGRSYVLVTTTGEAGVIAAPADYRVAVLQGGYAAWKAQVLTAPAPPVAEDAGAAAGYQERLALYSYFTGAAAAAPKIAPVSPPPGGGASSRPKAGGGC
jgi:hypothetical protein